MCITAQNRNCDAFRNDSSEIMLGYENVNFAAVYININLQIHCITITYHSAKSQRAVVIVVFESLQLLPKSRMLTFSFSL